MSEICNITEDTIKNIRFAWMIPVGQPFCNFENILSGTSISHIISGLPEKEILKIELLPDDIGINTKQTHSDAGAFSAHSYSIRAQPNDIGNQRLIHYFINKRVLLFLFTDNETFLIGSNEQGLLFLYEEYTTYFTLHLNGDTYLPALRN